MKLLTGKKKRYARAGLFFARRQVQNELREKRKEMAAALPAPEAGTSGSVPTEAGPSSAHEGQARKKMRR